MADPVRLDPFQKIEKPACCCDCGFALWRIFVPSLTVNTSAFGGPNTNTMASNFLIRPIIPINRPEFTDSDERGLDFILPSDGIRAPQQSYDKKDMERAFVGVTTRLIPGGNIYTPHIFYWHNNPPSFEEGERVAANAYFPESMKNQFIALWQTSFTHMAYFNAVMKPHIDDFIRENFHSPQIISYYPPIGVYLTALKWDVTGQTTSRPGGYIEVVINLTLLGCKEEFKSFEFFFTASMANNETYKSLVSISKGTVFGEGAQDEKSKPIEIPVNTAAPGDAFQYFKLKKKAGGSGYDVQIDLNPMWQETLP